MCLSCLGQDINGLGEVNVSERYRTSVPIHIALANAGYFDMFERVDSDMRTNSACGCDPDRVK
jgi:hypothetical protein